MNLKANYFSLNNVIRWSTSPAAERLKEVEQLSKAMVINKIISIVNEDKFHDGDKEEFNASLNAYHYEVSKADGKYILNANGVEFDLGKDERLQRESNSRDNVVSTMDTNKAQSGLNSRSEAISNNHNSSDNKNKHGRIMYDLNELNRIPLEDICQRYGIHLQDRGSRLWGKLRPEEKTPSFYIRKENNLWYDAGLGKGGNGVSLVSYLDNVEPRKAISILANMYHVRPIEGYQSNEWMPLTDNQYRELGLQPEVATMNMKVMDAMKYSQEKLTDFAEKYGMPLGELATENPDVYNSVVKSVSLESINSLRLSYYGYVVEYYKANSDDIFKGLYESRIQEFGADINGKVDLLNRALTDGTNFDFLKANIQEDMKEFNRDIPMGNISYSALKKTGELNYKSLTSDEFELIHDDLTENVKYAAFFKHDTGLINLAFKKADKETVSKIFEKHLSMEKINGNQVNKASHTHNADTHEIGLDISNSR